jgi:HAD superfamily hydrolase (TIGR01549 family)
LIEADGDGHTGRIEFFDAVQQRFDIPIPAEQLLEEYWVDYLSCFRPDPEVIEVLRRLRRAGWKIAVVTNGGNRQVVKMERSGIVELLDAWCISEEVGAAKPVRLIFEEAARRCGVPLAGWMVGDTAVADIQGGQGAGLRTIWMSRGRTWEIGGFRPDVVADSLTVAVGHVLASE